MTTSIDEKFDVTSLGLVNNHAYTLLNIIKINGIKLFKLRNPWGRGEWKGKWNDNDNDNWTQDIKEQLNVVNSDDGIFYIEWDDYVK